MRDRDACIHGSAAGQSGEMLASHVHRWHGACVERQATMKIAYSFCVSFWRVCRGVLPQAAFVLLLAGMAGAQSTLTFKSTEIPSDTGILQVLTADFNGDGNQDLVFLQVFRITVVLGNGDGTFQPPIHMPVNAARHFSAMAVGDFNNDGKADVAVVGATVGTPYGTPFLQTYLGKCDGTFSAPVSSPSSSVVGGVPLVGDVNHDGNLDLIGDGVVALGAGDGTFQQTITASACLNPAVYDLNIGSPPYAGGGGDFTVADFKGDGNLDFSLLATELSDEGGFGYLLSAGAIVCFGNGEGAFAVGPVILGGGSHAFWGEPGPSFELTTGDFNGDGKADVLEFSQAAQGVAYSTIFGPSRERLCPICASVAELPSETCCRRYERRRQVRPDSKCREPGSPCSSFERRGSL
jgi:hypothetical protein